MPVDNFDRSNPPDNDFKKKSNRQGNRASKALNERPKEIVAPTRFFEFPAM